MRVLVLLGILAVATSAFGDMANVVNIDENGNGRFGGGPLQYAVGTEPVSGMSTLYYVLPNAATQGDLVILDSGGMSSISDIVRFGPIDTMSGTSEVFFFSKADGDPPSLADVPQLPTAGSPRATLIEKNGSVSYTPLSGQPGYIAGMQVTYNIVSDVPEPATFALLIAGLLTLKTRRNGSGVL